MQHLIPAAEDDRHLSLELETKFDILKKQLLENGSQYSSKNNEKMHDITSQSCNNTVGEASHIALSIAKSAQNEIDSLLKGISELEDFLGNDSYGMNNEAFDTYHYDVKNNNSYGEARRVFEFMNERLGNTTIQRNK